MHIKFCVGGRLGNAIFRYMACTIMCLYYHGKYIINFRDNNNDKIKNCNEDLFLEIIKNIMNNEKLILQDTQINMKGYYQHDIIYKNHKSQIIDYINKNENHYVLTDGVLAGDKQYEKFYMIQILNTPAHFNKRYKNVLHVRLEDFVTYNLYLNVNRIINLLKKNIITESLCIVCKKTETDFEDKYIKKITNFIGNKMQVIVESNDTLTDFYIMKEAEILICSKSTLSWCAAFFSDKITKCYLPDYKTTNNSTCKYPIDNTELY
jgi:hypothetical protein